MPLIITPQWLGSPERMGQRRGWGFATQLYSVRSQQSWGVGDLTDLEDLAVWSAAEHAGGFRPRQPAPCGRAGTADGAVAVPAQQSSLCQPALSATRTHPGVRRGRRRAAGDDRHDQSSSCLPRLPTQLRLIVIDHGRPSATHSRSSFRCRVRRDEKPPLRRIGVARDLACERFANLGCAVGGLWPELLTIGRPNCKILQSPAVAAFAAGECRQDRLPLLVAVADGRAAGRRAAGGPTRRHGARGDARSGRRREYPWRGCVEPAETATPKGVSVGCPPDPFNQHGQDWNQPPWRPDRLAATAYAPIRDMVSTILRHAGGLRVDHVIGLFRLWWIPQGAAPTQGTYVRYDHEAMIGILALEAHRAGAVVVGEDLGTVEPWVRDYLRERGILGTSILWFEFDWDGDGKPLAPEKWREYCLASVTTHDLPPTAGYLAGDHVRLRDQLGILTRSLDEELQADQADRQAWLDNLRDRGRAAARGRCGGNRRSPAPLSDLDPVATAQPLPG